MLPIKSTAPVRYPPVATWSLIAINCVVFLFETSLSEAQLEEFLSQFALVPSHFSDPAGVGDYLPFVSNMFLHGGWLHLIFNMWTLWLFGRRSRISSAGAYTWCSTCSVGYLPR